MEDRISQVDEVDVLLLCGGFGSRLASVVSDRPKPMAEMNERPFLDLLIDYFAGFGLRRFILCAGHKSGVIKDHYAKRAGALEFVVCEETVPLGTAGAIRNAQNLIGSDTFLAVNGDSFCPVDLKAVYEFHRAEDRLMSMVVTESADTSDCGSVLLDESQRIVGFREKQPGTGFVNAGIYFFEKSILDLIPEGEKTSLEYDIFPKLADDNAYAFICDEELIDIGTPQRYELAKKYFAQKAEIVSIKNTPSQKFTPKAKNWP